MVPAPLLLAAVRGCCIASTLVVIFSGVPSIVSVARAGTTGGRSALPFAAQLLDNAIGWWLSSISGDVLGQRFRALSLLMTTLYLAVFIRYAPSTAERAASLTHVIRVVAALGALGAGVVTLVPRPGWRDVLGVAVTCSAVSFAASPLAELGRVLKTRDASSIPLPLMAAVTACSASWAAWGLLRRDPWMLLPNVLNCALGAAQVALALALPGPPAAPSGGPHHPAAVVATAAAPAPTRKKDE